MGAKQSTPLLPDWDFDAISQIPNYYQALEVSPNASIPEIRAAYQRLSKTYHPDKQHTPMNGSTPRNDNNFTTSTSSSSPLSYGPSTPLGTISPGGGIIEPDDTQVRLNNYKTILDNPESRAFYDCVTTYRYPDWSIEQRMYAYHKFRQEQHAQFWKSILMELEPNHQHDISSSLTPTNSMYNSELEYQRDSVRLSHSTSSSISNTDSKMSSKSSDYAASGKLKQFLTDPNKIFILQALYGDIINANDMILNPHPGHTLDVTWALRHQYAITTPEGQYEFHFQPTRIDLAGVCGDGSFMHSPGFYDPNFLLPNWNGENRLYIRYFFRGRLYEGIICDGDNVLIPDPEHIVDIDDCMYQSDRCDMNLYDKNIQIHLSEDVDIVEPQMIAATRNSDQIQDRNCKYVPIINIDQTLMDEEKIFYDHPQLSSSTTQYIFQTDHRFRSTMPSLISPTTQALVITTPSPLTSTVSIQSTTSSTTSSIAQQESISLSTSSSSIEQKSSSTTPTINIEKDINDEIDYDLIHRTSLAYLPRHVAGRPLYSTNGIMLSAHDYTQKLATIKASRRKKLYMAIGMLFGMIMTGLQYAGVIDMIGWGSSVANRCQHLLEYVQNNRRARNDDVSDV